MATTIQEKPFEISWSKNLIRYVLKTNTDIYSDGLFIEVQLFFKATSDSDFLAVFQQALTPDGNGIVTFYPHSILDAYLEYTYPDADIITPQLLATQRGEYYIRYRELSEASPNPEWQDETDLFTKKVLKGGLSYERWQGPNYFVNYAATARPFLTWQTSGRLASLDERMFLTFLMPRDQAGNVLMKVRVVYTNSTEDNSVNAAFPPTVNKYSVFSIPTGAAQLALHELNPIKKIWYYEIRVEDGDGLLAGPFKYVIDYVHTYNDTDFNFINSLGGFDSVRILGEIDGSVKRDTTLGTITPAAGYLDDNVLSPQEFVQAIGLSIEYKGNIGYVGKKQAIYLIDLFASKNVVQYKFGRWWPVTLTSAEVPIPNSNDDLPSIPLAWRYGFTNTQFTPDFIDIGNLPSCPIVTNVIVTPGSLVDNVVWTGAVAHTNYRVKYVLNGEAPDSPKTTGILYTSITSAQVPHSDYGGTLYITAICTLGNESQTVTKIIG